MTVLKAVREKCLECSGGQRLEVRECVIPKCPLYPYRMGTNPARTGKGGRGRPKGSGNKTNPDSRPDWGVK